MGYLLAGVAIVIYLLMALSGLVDLKKLNKETSEGEDNAEM